MNLMHYVPDGLLEPLIVWSAGLTAAVSVAAVWIGLLERDPGAARLRQLAKRQEALMHDLKQPKRNQALIRSIGLRTGRFPSPHLESMTERIVLEGKRVDADVVVTARADKEASELRAKGAARVGVRVGDKACAEILLAAEREGRSFLFRTGPSFVRALSGLEPKPPLRGEQIRPPDAGARGGHAPLLAGSYGGPTPRQLAALPAARGNPGNRLHVRAAARGRGGALGAAMRYRTIARPLRAQAFVPPRTETVPSNPCESRKFVAELLRLPDAQITAYGLSRSYTYWLTAASLRPMKAVMST